MKLKTVRAEFEFVLVVEDDDKTPWVSAREHVKDALQDLGEDGISVSVRDYTRGSCDAWSDGDEPYGGEGGMTTGDYLKLSIAKAAP